MDAESVVAELVAPLRADNVSGSAELGRTAAEVVRRAAVRLRAGSLDELRDGVGRVCGAVLDTHPSMAALVALVRTVLGSLETATSLEEGRLAAAHAADAFRHDSEARIMAVARQAAALLPPGGRVATVSASETVSQLLLEEAGPRGLGVLCFESRPANEGRAVATALARAGVDVTYAVDAAAQVLLPHCDAVLLGADSVGDAGVVNKIGSTVVARIARAAAIPVQVLADTTKLLPPGFPQFTEDDRPASEVWDAPRGVSVWNRYFEVMPLSLADTIVTEHGLLDSASVREFRESLDLPAALRVWAAGRADAALDDPS